MSDHRYDWFEGVPGVTITDREAFEAWLESELHGDNCSAEREGLACCLALLSTAEEVESLVLVEVEPFECPSCGVIQGQTFVPSNHLPTCERRP